MVPIMGGHWLHLSLAFCSTIGLSDSRFKMFQNFKNGSQQYCGGIHETSYDKSYNHFKGTGALAP